MVPWNTPGEVLQLVLSCGIYKDLSFIIIPSYRFPLG
jgi:hypothetical protein